MCISHELYGYIGEELLLVKGNVQKSYGALEYRGENILKDKEILEASYLNTFGDGGVLVSIVTSCHETMLIVLY